MSEVNTYIPVDEDDMGQILWLLPKETGLPVLLFLSDVNCFMGPGIWFYNSYSQSFNEDYDNIVPVSATVDPYFMPGWDIQISEEDQEKIKRWIIKNIRILKSLFMGDLIELQVSELQQPIVSADLSIDRDAFKALYESKLKNEMANFPKDITGLPTFIYVSAKQGSHNARIKFLDSKADKIGKNLNLWIPLTIEDDPKIPEGIKPKTLSKSQVEKIRQWIIVNKESLLQLWEMQITVEEFKQGMVQVS